MTGNEFKLIVKGLKSVYADPKFLADEDAINMWFRLLKDIPYDIASMATQAYMQSERFSPTPADIRRYATKIQSPVTDDMSELEAWSLVRKAVNNGIYGSEEEFAKLPKVVQRALGSHRNLKEMAQLNIGELETVEQSNFMRNYRAQLEAHKRESQLNESLRISIDQLRKENTPKIEVKTPDIPKIEEKRETGISESVENELAEFKARMGL